MAEISLLEEADPETAQRRVTGDAGTVDAAADDDEVEAQATRTPDPPVLSSPPSM